MYTERILYAIGQELDFLFVEYFSFEIEEKFSTYKTLRKYLIEKAIKRSANEAKCFRLNEDHFKPIKKELQEYILNYLRVTKDREQDDDEILNMSLVV